MKLLCDGVSEKSDPCSIPDTKDSGVSNPLASELSERSSAFESLWDPEMEDRGLDDCAVSVRLDSGELTRMCGPASSCTRLTRHNGALRTC